MQYSIVIECMVEADSLDQAVERMTEDLRGLYQTSPWFLDFSPPHPDEVQPYPGENP